MPALSRFELFELMVALSYHIWESTWFVYSTFQTWWCFNKTCFHVWCWITDTNHITWAIPNMCGAEPVPNEHISTVHGFCCWHFNCLKGTQTLKGHVFEIYLPPNLASNKWNISIIPGEETCGMQKTNQALSQHHRHDDTLSPPLTQRHSLSTTDLRNDCGRSAPQWNHEVRSWAATTKPN